MDQYMETIAWSAKAEPSSPFSIDDNYWTFGDDPVSDGLLLSVPLSLIQESRETALFQHPEDCSDEFISPDLSYEPSSPEDYQNGQCIPTIKYEDTFASPVYSPIGNSPSGSSSPIYSEKEVLLDSSSPDDKTTRAELASKLLNELDQYKEEPICDWLEEKIILPDFEEYNPPKEPIQDTQSLLLEFESVCGTIGLNNIPQFIHLTPPQSPPGTDYSQTSAPLHQLHNALPVHSSAPDQSPFDWHLNVQLEPINTPDIEKELSVDDIVRHAAQSITWEEKEPTFNTELANAHETDPIDINEFSHAYVDINQGSGDADVSTAPYYDSSDHAYVMSVGEESSPSPYSPSSSSCSTYGSSENDDEWIQPSPQKSSKSKSSKSKPYSRYPDDKKSRKKEQNKNAATRYRQKKKAEIEILMEEEKELQVKNKDLSTRYTDLQREVSYIKGLLRELFKIKGLIK